MMAQAENAATCDRLFVYGTLRRGFALHHHLERLAAAFEGEGRVAGELWDLGEFYPGARKSDGAGAWIIGEVFRLRRPLEDLVLLDDVEVFFPAAPDRSEFIREIAQVVLTAGGEVPAWIYWLGPAAKAVQERIASGDFARLG
jgi:gamma-glutamylcyclotransferase (GGCT)/AIG2-like uncharacterized protein YtfP